ncbi:MAG: hypothetical protein JHC26_10830 [Thermofilum sp.]|jgi:hypothetical protein|uniref:hypothetical protein n=1 Tax=Thermofilum sp. TaxID=1961369 RepID=UPI00258D61DC|nr:hypothetical protein [Thermofilum sp.]MCI4409576.1 hypothetical protein [Thermofilum sp.]
MSEEVQLVRIDLDPLYEYGVNYKSEDLLKMILDQYEAIEYKLLFSASPDIDVKYFDSDFRDYVMEYPDDIDIVDLAVKYAETHGYEKVVVLDDGYEEAIAVVKERGE